MNLRYTIILAIFFTILAFSRGFVLQYHGIVFSNTPHAHADGSAGAGGDGGGDGGGSAGSGGDGGGSAGGAGDGGGSAGGTGDGGGSAGTAAGDGGGSAGTASGDGGGSAGDAASGTGDAAGGSSGEVVPPPPTPVFGCMDSSATNYNPSATSQMGVNCTYPLPPPPAPLCTLSAAPATITNGSNSILFWTTTNATSFSINHSVGVVTPVASGMTSVIPPVTTTYTGTAIGSGGSVQCSATVTVTVPQPPPPPPPAPICTLSASPTTIQTGSLSALLWTTTNATSFSIDHTIGSVTPMVSGARSIWPTTTTTYTGTAIGAGGSVICSAIVTVTATPPPPPPPPVPAPICTLTAAPTAVVSGSNSILSWTTTNAVSFSIDTGIGNVVPVLGGSTTTPAIKADTSFTGTATNSAGSTVTCTAAVTVTVPPPPPSGGGGGSSRGGGGGSSSPTIILSALPHVGAQPLSFLYLSQIPYTGLDLGPMGTVVYWLVLIGVMLALTYILLFRVAPSINRSLRDFGSRVLAILNAPGLAPVALSPAAPSVERELPEAPRGYSSYDGFKSFAHKGALSIEDVVKGLSQEHPKKFTEPESASNVEPIYEGVEPVYENVEPIESDTVATTTEISADTRGFTIALIEGDRAAVFAGLRQQVRGGGAPEQLISAAVCFLDDVYRARIDGTDCDATLARMTARLSTPLLEKLIASLTIAIDSSYSSGITGAKLALTRALAVLGA